MTDKAKKEISDLIKTATGHSTTANGFPVETLADSIAQIADTEFANAIMTETSMGQMLEAVGLEIRSKG